MASRFASRALLLGSSAVRNAANYQIRRSNHICAHSRSLSLAAAARPQLACVEAPTPGSGVISASTGNNNLHVQFCDGQTSAIPYTWLRDNCQCHKCRQMKLHKTINPEFEMMVHPEMVQSNVFGVVVDWSDGHISKYPGQWLHRVAQNVIIS